MHAVVTHGLFVGDAIDRLRSAGIDRIWSTDSVPHETNAIPLAGLLASALSPGERSQPGGDDGDPRMPGISAGEAVRRRGNW